VKVLGSVPSSFLYAIVTSLIFPSPSTLYHQHRRQSIASSSVSPPTLVNAVWRNVFHAEEVKSFTFWLRPRRRGSQNRVRHGDICCLFYLSEGTRWRSTLKALNFKPEFGRFDSRWIHWHNSSDRTKSLGSTQPLAEISTRNDSWG
jgi:hypothetical protein